MSVASCINDVVRGMPGTVWSLVEFFVGFIEKGAQMGAVAVEEDSPEVREEAGERVRWHPLTRIAFRFCVVYFGLFCVAIPQIIVSYAGWFVPSLPSYSHMWVQRLFEPPLGWVGRVVFGVHAQVYLSGSGDQAIFWVTLFCVLIIAVVATAVWTLLDRRRTGYRWLAGWFLLVIRLLLAGQMLCYG